MVVKPLGEGNLMLFFIFLRRPRTVTDLRSDPFWEFGSFGQTGCHRTNLLHPARTPLREGDRLVFLQGGDQEIRAVALTPPIQIQSCMGRLDLRWDRDYRPIPYVEAPVLINNQGQTNFSAVFDIVADTQRSTFCGKAASRLRSLTRPIKPELATQLEAWFAQTDLPRVTHYLEAIDVADSAWFRYGLRAGWPDIDRRARHFAELTGVLPVLPADDSPAPNRPSPRRRC